MTAATELVHVVAGSHAVTSQVFAEIPTEHPVALRFADLDDPAHVEAATAGADAIVVDDEPLTREHLESLASSVRVVGKLGTGLDTVDVETARERGVAVVYLPGSAINEVADHTVALILASVRGLRAADAVARHSFDDWRRVGRLRALCDCTVGMIGLGRIGTGVLERLRPFGCRLIVVDPALSSAPDGAELRGDLDSLLREADVVNLQVPLSPATEGLIGARELRLMKADATLVNTTRGGVIDQAALVAALESGEIGGAALDVMADEPPAADDPILTAPRTILSPHVAWYSDGAEARMRDHTLTAIVEYLRGRPLSVGSLAT